MGSLITPVGHLCIDLSNIAMSGDDQRELLRAVEATVVAQLARIAGDYKVVTITMSPNNGQRLPSAELSAKPAPEAGG